MTDTIVAQATAPGRGAIAAVRLSGSGAFAVRSALARTLVDPPARTAMLADLTDPDSGELLDRGVVTSFPAPASYTGEDLVEISCHGGLLVPGLVVEAALAAGARLAEPGEFTRRAYLNGKMDLLQAEAVLDLVESRSRALHRAAVHQMERGLSKRVGAAREALVMLEALLVHHLDFPDEDEPPVEVVRVAEEAEEVAHHLRDLLATAPEGELLREGALTVLAGRPNVGKSSVFNALVGTDRAIVTEIPGTTRDALEAGVSVGEYPFRLVDTAGLRDTDERVESMGIEVARRYLARADLVLLCVENQAPIGQGEVEFLEELECPVVVLRTKSDLARDSTEDGRGDVARDAPMTTPIHEISISVRTGEGLSELKTVLPELVYRGLVTADPDTPILTRARHRRAMHRALSELDSFAQALRNGVPAEIAATHLRPAETALEEMLGIISLDDVLDRLFQDFCIGK